MDNTWSAIEVICIMTDQPYDVMTREEIEASWEEQNQNKEENKMEQNQTNWMQQELAELEKEQPHQNLKPALKLEENKVYEIEVIQNMQWEKWIEPATGLVKKIIPIRYNGNDMVFFLSTKNPLYRDMVTRCSKGQLKFRIVRTGIAKATRYSIVEG